MATASSTREDVLRVGHALQGSLRGCLAPLAGAHARPAHIARRLGMDTTLVWRIVRSADAPSALACMHGLPSPAGLEDFRVAVESAGGVDTGELARAVDAYASLIELFPAGRRGLNAAIEGWLPEARQKGMRSAAQDAFRAYAQLLGCQVDAHAIATIVAPPSSVGEPDARCDTVHVRVMQRIRRMRDGAAIALCSTARPTPGATGGQGGVTPVRGGVERGDIRDMLLTSDGLEPDEFEAHEVGGASVLTLPVGLPRVNAEATFALAARSRGVWRAYRHGTHTTEVGSYRYSVPCRASVNDLIVPRSLRAPGIPEVLLHMQGTSSGDPVQDRAAFELTRLPLGVSASSAIELDRDLGSLEWNEAPRYGESLREAFSATGLDPRDFVAFRVRLDWPPPFVTLTWFCGLADPPPTSRNHARS